MSFPMPVSGFEFAFEEGVSTCSLNEVIEKHKRESSTKSLHMENNLTAEGIFGIEYQVLACYQIFDTSFEWNMAVVGRPFEHKNAFRWTVPSDNRSWYAVFGYGRKVEGAVNELADMFKLEPSEKHISYDEARDLSSLMVAQWCKAYKLFELRGAGAGEILRDIRRSYEYAVKRAGKESIA
jgi:hypothetical protein